MILKLLVLKLQVFTCLKHLRRHCTFSCQKYRGSGKLFSCLSRPSSLLESSILLWNISCPPMYLQPVLAQVHLESMVEIRVIFAVACWYRALVTVLMSESVNVCVLYWRKVGRRNGSEETENVLQWTWQKGKKNTTIEMGEYSDFWYKAAFGGRLIWRVSDRWSLEGGQIHTPTREQCQAKEEIEEQ